MPPDPLRRAAPVLRCPLCAARLTVSERTVRCEAGHAFDVARHGYASLLRGDAPVRSADTAGMVAARHALLGGGHYRAVTDAVVRAAGRLPEGWVVDLGGGTGQHTAAVLDALPGRMGMVVDLSAHALRRAARAHPRLAAVRADVWAGLPLGDGVAALALCIFAPRNGPEIARVLHPDGRLVVVTPTARHLAELVEAVDLLTVDPDKDQRLRQALEPHLQPVGQQTVEQTLSLRHGDVMRLVAMGPSAHHLRQAQVAERLHGLPDPLQLTISVTVGSYGLARGADRTDRHP